MILSQRCQCYDASTKVVQVLSVCVRMTSSSSYRLNPYDSTPTDKINPERKPHLMIKFRFLVRSVRRCQLYNLTLPLSGRGIILGSFCYGEELSQGLCYEGFVTGDYDGNFELQSVLIAEPDEVPIFVDELHPDVLAIVEEVMANAKFEDADLPVTSIAIDTLTEAIANAEEEKLQRLPSASRSVVCCLSHHHHHHHLRAQRSLVSVTL